MKITVSYLKELRKKRNMTQRELALKTGFSQAHIAKIEGNKVDPRLSTVNKIINVLENEKKCKDIMTTDVFCVSSADSVKKAANLMKKRAISQLPVIDNGVNVGTVTEAYIMENFSKISEKKVHEIMLEPLPMLPQNSDIGTAKILLKSNNAILLSFKGRISGILTMADFLKLV